jgi:hypothetical protein
LQAIDVSDYGKLYVVLPPTWPLIELKPDLVTQFSSANVKTFQCYHPDAGNPFWDNYPFQNVVTSTQVPATSYQFPSLWQLTTGTETSTTEIWTFAWYDIYDEYADVSKTLVTSTLFTSGSGGGYGYPPAWYRSTYNPPFFVRWGSSYDHSSTEQHAPPGNLPKDVVNYTLG